jgi:hypothetical protein
MAYVLTQSPANGKKWRVLLPDGRHVDFGAEGYEDYTTHRDEARMRRYLARHGRGREDWSAAGAGTAGFWSRWILWSEPSLRAAVRRTAAVLRARVVVRRA